MREFHKGEPTQGEVPSGLQEQEVPTPPPDTQGYEVGDTVAVIRSGGKIENDWKVHKFDVEFNKERNSFVTWVTCLKSDGHTIKQIEARYLKQINETCELEKVLERLKHLKPGMGPSEQEKAPAERERKLTEFEKKLVPWIEQKLNKGKTADEIKKILQEVEQYLNSFADPNIDNQRVASEVITTLSLNIEGKDYDLAVRRAGLKNYSIVPTGKNMVLALEKFFGVGK